MKQLILLLLFASYLINPLIAHTLSEPQETPPAAPSDLVWSFDEYQIELNWKDNSENESGFIVSAKLFSFDYEVVDTLPAGSENFKFRLVSNYDHWTYSIKAFNTAGTSDSITTDEIATGIRIPDQPINVSVVPVSYSEVTLTWENADRLTVNSLVLRANSADGNYESVGGIFNNEYRNTPVGTVLIFTDVAGLQENTTYYYKILANTFLEGPPDNFIDTLAVYEVTTPAFDPEHVVSPSNCFIAHTSNFPNYLLQWKDNSLNETAFEIYRAVANEGPYEHIHTTPANTEAYTDSDLAHFTTYFYKVRAVNDSLSSIFSNIYSRTTPASNPGNLNIPSKTASSITLTWSDGANDYQAFEIQRRKLGEEYQKIAVVSRGIQTYTDENLEENTIYEYRLKYGVFYSSSSSTSTLSKTPPAAPSNLASSYDYYTIDLTWNDNATNESGFVVYRQYEGEGFEAIDTLAANSESYSDRIPYGRTQYTYYVVAYNLAGESDSSNTETLAIGYRTPTQPSNITLEALSHAEVKMTFENADSTSRFFTLYRSDSPLGPFEYADVIIGFTFHESNAQLNIDAFSLGYEILFVDIDSTLKESTTYYYKIYAATSYEYSYDGPGTDSAFRETLPAYEVTTLERDPQHLLAPSKLWANANANDNDYFVQFGWLNNAEEATAFEVYRAVSEKGPYSKIEEVQGYGLGYRSIEERGLDPYTTYYYKVRAVKGNFFSNFSVVDSVTTNPVTPVLLPIDDIIVKEGETYTVEVSVDNNYYPYGPLFLQLGDNLEFANLTDHGNGTGTLTFSPSKGDAGVYTTSVAVVGHYYDSDYEVFNVVVKPAESEEFNTVLYRVNSGYTALADSPMDWSTDIRTNRSPYFNLTSVNTSAGWNYFGYFNPTNAPNVLFGSQRIGYNWGPAMEYNFPVEGAVEVTLFFAERETEVTAAGQRVFNINMEGMNVETNFDIYAEAGRNAISKTYYTHVTDGSLDVILDRVIGNPLISGIEVRGNTNTVNAMAAKGISGQIAKTAMDEEVGEGIEKAVVYPNPFTEGLNIALPYDFTHLEYLAIMDGAGRVVYQQTAFEPGTTLALEAYRLNLARGLYYLTIKPSGAPRQNFKIIKQ